MDHQPAFSQSGSPRNSRDSRHIDAPTDWKEHEHFSPALQLSALRLLTEAGTLGVAIQALETAERLSQDAEAFEVAFARGCGHESYSDLVGASTTVGAEEESPWYITPIAHDRWLAWNKMELHEAREFGQRSAAEEYALRQSGSAP